MPLRPPALMRPLRVYLLALVVGVVVPLVVLTTAQAIDGARRQRAAIEASLVDASTALARSVEQELLRSIAALQVLAASSRLASGDLTGFAEEARDAMGRMPWYTVWLADADGQQLVNLLLPAGAPLPSVADRDYVAEALRMARPVVSGLIVGRVSRQPNVTVAVPRLRAGKPTHVIGAALRLGLFNDILATVAKPLQTATASIVGRDHIVIARNRDASRWVGRPAHKDYIRAMNEAPTGLGRASTLEGQAVYVAYSRLAGSGWTVGIGVLRTDVEGPLRRAIWISVVIGLAGLLLSSTVAVLLGRRITVPIKTLAAAAEGIALRRQTPVPQTSSIAEIATLARALQFAAEATRERDQLAEQARHITAELEAVEIRERQQIARDLHDDLAQTLSAAQIRLAQLKAHADPAVTRTAAELADLVGRASHSTRSLAEQLSPPALYELGLVPALEWLAQQLGQDYGLEVEIQDDGEPKPLSHEAASIVFRCVRELLINVAKHAQTGAAAVVLLVEGGRELVIHVVDAGRGIDLKAARARNGRRRLGLWGVEERLAHLGGRFEIAPLPGGGGTEARLRLPLKGGNADSGEGGGALPPDAAV